MPSQIGLQLGVCQVAAATTIRINIQLDVIVLLVDCRWILVTGLKSLYTLVGLMAFILK